MLPSSFVWLWMGRIPTLLVLEPTLYIIWIIYIIYTSYKYLYFLFYYTLIPYPCTNPYFKKSFNNNIFRKSKENQKEKENQGNNC